MAVIVGSARSDERGKATGGAAGNQNGKELSTQNWYLNTKGWVLLRARDETAREKIAACMEAACKNQHIGYDQSQRDTLYNAAKNVGFDAGKVTKNVETDCSALVRVCVNYAGITVGNFRTTNQASVLMATGAFDKFTDDLHCKKSTNLLRGDILVTKTQGHTVVVLSDGANAKAERKGYALGDRILKNGDGGADVKELQEKLTALGYDVGESGCDGDFGDDTEKAVKQFQKANKLEADGEYGPKTHAALIAAQTEKLVTITGEGSTDIRMGNGPDFALYCTVGKDARYKYVATAANGWHAIVIEGRVCWVDGKNTDI